MCMRDLFIGINTFNVDEKVAQKEMHVNGEIERWKFKGQLLGVANEENEGMILCEHRYSYISFLF